MIERGPSFEPKGSLRDLLSDEEFREILAPFPGDPGVPGEVVLLLGEDPEDAESVSAWLLAHGARAQPVLDRYGALDELRGHEFAAFIIAVESLGADPSRYLERVREARSPLRLGFIADAGAPVPAWLEEEGTLVRRPLDDEGLARLFPWAVFAAAAPAPDAPAAGTRSTGEPWGDEPAGASRPPPLSPPRPGGAPLHPPLHPPFDPPRLPPGPPAPFPTPAGARAPDWIAAVRALLEARRDGIPLLDALRRWAEGEPGCAGWGEVRDDAGTLSLRAGGTDRAALIAALATELASAPEAPLAPESRGGFACLPGEGGWTALWWRDSETGRRGFDRFATLIPLVDALRPPTAGSPPVGNAPRERLLRLLDARMHAVRRHGGSLGLLLVVPADPTHLLPVVDELAPRLRGEDWLEIEAGRLWVLLERPDPTVAAAISARLLALPVAASLRAIGAPWRPGGERAEELSARLEREVARLSPGQVHWSE